MSEQINLRQLVYIYLFIYLFIFIKISNRDLGGGRNVVTARFLRHFNTIVIDDFNEGTLTSIFNAIMEWHLFSRK